MHYSLLSTSSEGKQLISILFHCSSTLPTAKAAKVEPTGTQRIATVASFPSSIDNTGERLETKNIKTICLITYAYTKVFSVGLL